MASQFKPAEVIAIAFLAGFAIQQLLQILDLVITPWIIRDKEKIWSLPAVDFKKGLMYSISFLCGWLIAWALDINLLEFAINDDKAKWLGILISGFVLGSGTEAANTLIKYFGYLKDAQKHDIKPEPEVLIIPSTATVKVNETLEFKSVVKNNPNQVVSWRVLQGNSGGKINEGTYTAPATAGIYTVIATSASDESIFAPAKVTVTA